MAVKKNRSTPVRKYNYKKNELQLEFKAGSSMNRFLQCVNDVTYLKSCVTLSQENIHKFV